MVFLLAFSISRCYTLSWVEQQITTDNYSQRPSLYNGTIAWDSSALMGTYQIFYWDGANTTQITNGGFHSHSPSLYNGTIAWAGSDGSDYEIFYYDGTTTTQLTDNTVNDSDPSLGNNEIAFTRSGSSNNYRLNNNTSAPVPEPLTVVSFLSGIFMFGFARTSKRK